MCPFKIAYRIFLLAVIFLGVGFSTSHLLIVHAVERGAPEYDVRLAGLMGGLFAGGAAALLAGLALFLGGTRPRRADQGEDRVPPAH